MRKLLITTYLQFFWNDINLKPEDNIYKLVHDLVKTEVGQKLCPMSTL